MNNQTNDPEPDPRIAAEEVYSAHRGETGWLDAFAEHLDRHRSSESLARSLSIWGLSQAEAARLLGISRQAIGKWLERGAPSERLIWVGNLAVATDILVHYLQRDRIPAVVRRAIPACRNRSLIDMLASDEAEALVVTTRAMFSFDRA